MNFRVLFLLLAISVPSLSSASAVITGIRYVSLVPSGTINQLEFESDAQHPFASTIVFQIPRAIPNRYVQPNNGKSQFAALDGDLVFSDHPTKKASETIDSVDLRVVGSDLPAFSIGLTNLVVWTLGDARSVSWMDQAERVFSNYIANGKLGLDSAVSTPLQAYLRDLRGIELKQGIDIQIRTSKRVINFKFPTLTALEGFLKGNQDQVTESRVPCRKWIPAFIYGTPVTTRNFEISFDTP